MGFQLTISLDFIRGYSVVSAFLLCISGSCLILIVIQEQV